MCDSNTDMDILNTTDVEAGHKIDKASMEEVGTFTGDDLSFAVVGSSSTDVEEKKVVASASTGTSIHHPDLKRIGTLRIWLLLGLLFAPWCH